MLSSLPGLRVLYNTTTMSMFFDSQNKPTIDLQQLPDSEAIPNGTRCIWQDAGREIELYTHPSLNERLIRIPTGDHNNWCAIYALGLENDQQARNVIAQYNGAFVDAYDQVFWTQMANILNAPVEIYRALNFGRPDPLNGTLELVVRYGTGTGEPRRIFARFGHYNALLGGNDPDAILYFMSNQSGQGELAF